MTRRAAEYLVTDAIAAQLGTFPYGPKPKRGPPLSPERAREALARHAEWRIKNRVAEQTFGWPGPIRDVSAELTDAEHAALWDFFDGDPRRPTITWMVEICARGEAFDR